MDFLVVNYNCTLCVHNQQLPITTTVVSALCDDYYCPVCIYYTPFNNSLWGWGVGVYRNHPQLSVLETL